ncbi:hypothetical protein IGI39_004536 [Enterococcus sp. AZ135]
MAKLQISIDDELKHNAEKLIDELGLTPRTAITIFYKQMYSRQAVL